MSEYLKDRAPNIDELVRKLEACGFKFQRFENSCVDPCLPVDVEWNYKDIVHVGFVHSHMSRQFLYIGQNIYTTIDLQNFLGTILPQSGAFYVTDDNRIIVHTTLFFYVIFVEIKVEQIADLQTRSETRYAVGSRSRFLSLFIPLIRFVMRRNWKQFVADDGPLRSRRGDLRKQGFTFTDVSPIDHRATLNITGVGVTPPLASPDERVYEFNLADNIAQTKLVGESDHFGVIIQFEADTIRIFPRLCPHRGAILDTKEAKGSTISCPWHGRKFPPLASITLDGNYQSFAGPLHHCDYDGEKLTLRTLADVNMADKFDWTLAWTKV